MASYRGMDGYVSLGGILVGTPLVNGALLAGATTLSIDGSSLTGVLAVGDTFTLAGESGSPTHVVTGGPFYVAAANAIANITFSTVIAAGGVANNAVVTFASNSVAQVRTWDINVTQSVLDVTVKGNNHQQVVGGRVSATGTVGALFDYGVSRQQALIDKIAGTPDGTAVSLVLGAATSKQFYLGAVLSSFSVESPEDDIVPVTFDFVGDGVALVDWN